MAHPTIDITKQPSADGLNPAYNCVKFGFECTDFQTTIGTYATFTIDCSGLIGTSIAPSGVLLIASNTYLTSSTTTDFKNINTSAVLTPSLLATRIKAALEANNNIFNEYDIVITGGNVVTATAREIGVKANFSFSYSGFVGSGVTNSETNGTNNVYRDNYRLVVQIWKSELNGIAPLSKSGESYIPNSNGTFEINIGEKIAPFLKSRFVHAVTLATVHYDDLICKKIFLRYGELYSDTLSQCDAKNRNFDSTDLYRVINSAFQRADEEEKTEQMESGEFMTNTPDYTEMCTNSIGYLWQNLYDIAIFPAPTDIQYRPFFEIFYSDGTSSKHIGSALADVPAFENRIACIQSGWNVIGDFATVGKTPLYYRVRFVVRDISLPVPTGDTYFGSKYFKLIQCCDNQMEFYFLNEFGGFDTITMTQLTSIELEQDNGIFESFLDCEDKVIATDGTGAKGKSIINQTANDVFEVTGKFANDYNSRLWLREFLTSPEKYVRKTIGEENQIFSKIIVEDFSAKYYSKDDNTIVLKFKYTLNESLNIQKN